MPGHLGLAPQTSMVGRARELGQLRDALSRLLSASGGFVLVSGEAGIGKTTLIAELSRETGEHRVYWNGVRSSRRIWAASPSHGRTPAWEGARR